MSAGAFVRSKYEASYANNRVHPIRVQPETITLEVGGIANTPPADAISIPISALVSRNRRARGLIVRTVTLQAPATNPPAGYLANGLTTLPCLTEAFFDACAAADDSTTVDYLGVSGYSVAYVSDEKVR